MKSYASSLVLHILSLVLLAASGVYAAMHGLWFCTAASAGVIAGIGISLYRMQTRQVQTMKRIVDCMKNNDLSQLACPAFSDRNMQMLAEDLSAALKTIRTHLNEEETKHQYYESLLNRVDTAVLVCCENGRMEWMNKAAQKLLGNCNILPEEISGALKNQQAVARLQSRPIPAELAVTATQIQLKGKTFWLVSLKNIHTALEQTEMEAWQKLIRVLTHEIMNSITPIISLADTLSERSVTDSADNFTGRQMQQGLQVIRRRSKSLLEFVENYRKLTRIAPPAKTDIDVHDFFNGLQQLFAGKPFLSFKLPDNLPRWKADRGQMEQVFINLIKNALEACEHTADASVCISVSATGKEWNFQVTDNGEGILPEVTERIFVPFFTTKSGGSGIGLAICKQIVLLHGGQISVESQPNKGSRFILSFPGYASIFRMERFRRSHVTVEKRTYHIRLQAGKCPFMTIPLALAVPDARCDKFHPAFHAVQLQVCQTAGVYIKAWQTDICIGHRHKKAGMTLPPFAPDSLSEYVGCLSGIIPAGTDKIHICWNGRQMQPLQRAEHHGRRSP